MVTKQAPEALEEIAQSIVDAHKYETRAVGHEGCDACTEADANAVAAILSALRNERERCAKIVNAARGENYDLRDLVKAIREGKSEDAK